LLSVETWAQESTFARILDPRALDERLGQGTTIQVLAARLLENVQAQSPDTKGGAGDPFEVSHGDEERPGALCEPPWVSMLLSLPEEGLDLNRGDEVLLHRGPSTGPAAFRARIITSEAGSVTVRLRVPSSLRSRTPCHPEILRESNGWFLDRLPFSRGTEISGQALYHFFVKGHPQIVDVVIRGNSESGPSEALEPGCQTNLRDDSRETVRPEKPDIDAAIPDDLCFAEGLQAELNEDQEAAVEAAFHSSSYHLIHGPPGTGKTRVLARLVKMCLDHGQRVLVACPTNVALDRMLVSLIDLGVRDFVRIGRKSTVSHEFLDALASLGHPPALLDDLASQGLDTKTFRKRVAETMLVSATAYQCAAHPMFRRQRFDLVVVDEAGQLDEPSTLGPLALAPKFVLGGDHLQLPPIVQTSSTNAVPCDDPGLEQSLFERLFRSEPRSRISALRVQYRMNREVQEIPSRIFYEGSLVPSPEVAKRRLNIKGGSRSDEQIDRILAPDHPVVFVDVPGTDGGKWRAEEASFASVIAKGLLAGGVPATEVGIITPYRAQQSLIRRELSAGRDHGPLISVDTVDRFQGGEREVIILSLARSDGVTSFLADRKRLNVSLSRARSKLILLGHAQTLEEHPLFCAVLEGLERISIE
jgi:DNA replication ATP-dependent helicase Dna2